MTGPARQDVLRLITRLNIGGPARQALMLTRELEAWPTLLAAGRPSPEEGELADPQVLVEHVSLVRPIRPATDMGAVLQVRRLLERVKPRILHTHMAKAGIVGRLAARKTAIRTVHTFHGHVLDGYFRKPVERAFLEIERRLARATDILIAISPEIRDDLLSRGVGTPTQYRVIPLGFDLTDHLRVVAPDGGLRRALGVAADVPLVGTVSRLVPIKDIATLLRAMALLPDVHLVVLGDGEERPRLEALRADLGLEGRCHFTGWWLDIPGAMSDLDVVALTSLNEGTPVSLIEALACARPVVATSVGGVPFVIRHNETGLLVSPRDPAALAASIQELLGSRDKAVALATAGRADVATRFHKDRLLADIGSLYDEVVSS